MAYSTPVIALLAGTVETVQNSTLVVFTQSGVGYAVNAAGSLLSQVKKGKTITIRISTQVREDSITLYGFGTDDEKALFEKLLGISGIGPKVAMSILSTPIDLFLNAVAEGDIATITRVPGIGKKSAQRLIVELQGKLDLSPETTNTTTGTPAEEEAVAALTSLGYDAKRIREAIKTMNETDAESMIRSYLKHHA